jgi:hypothetical protein
MRILSFNGKPFAPGHEGCELPWTMEISIDMEGQGAWISELTGQASMPLGFDVEGGRYEGDGRVLEVTKNPDSGTARLRIRGTSPLKYIAGGSR